MEPLAARHGRFQGYIPPVNRLGVAPCRRRHPDWRDGVDYDGQVQLRDAWQVIGAGLFARHIDHEGQCFDGSTTMPLGAVVRYLGTNYWHNTYFDEAHHVFQILEAGPGFAASDAVSPLLREPLKVGDCYEVSEYIDDDSSGRWWPAVLAPATLTPVAP
jgi:hypothetical protein